MRGTDCGLLEDQVSLSGLLDLWAHTSLLEPDCAYPDHHDLLCEPFDRNEYCYYYRRTSMN